MKSNSKGIRARIKKNPAIVSNVHPYKDMPVYAMQQNEQDWYKWVKLLTFDEAARIEYGQKLFDYCNTNYNLHTINNRRFAIYNKLIGNADIQM